MFRKELREVLLNQPMSVSRIARLVEESPGQIAEDLAHLFRSLKHSEYRTVVEPATCRGCGFIFSYEKLKKPSKCPECHSTWVTEPRIAIERRNESRSAKAGARKNAEGRKPKASQSTEAEEESEVEGG